MNRPLIIVAVVALVICGCSTKHYDRIAGPYYIETRSTDSPLGGAWVRSRLLYRQGKHTKEIGALNERAYGGEFTYRVFGTNLVFVAWNAKSEKHELRLFSERQQRIIVVDSDLTRFWRVVANARGLTCHRPKVGVPAVLSLVEDPNPVIFSAEYLRSL